MREYSFSRKAVENLQEFEDENARKILEKINEAAEENFYNHSSYSYFFDRHGDTWDKLDLKIEEKQVRAVFTEKNSEIYILFIADRDDFEYDSDLFSVLSRMEG